MTRGAVLFDRDGTLTRDDGYTFRLGDLQLLPGAAAAVRAVNAAGLAAIVVTNQSGVARGLFTESEMWAFNTAMALALAGEGARLDAIYACPFLPDAPVAAYADPDPYDRKPNPGMLLRAAADFGLDPAHCLMVGDSYADMEAASRAGMRSLRATGAALDALLTPALVGFPHPLG